MISPTKKSEHVITDSLAGERRAFTIKATGKAFRTLIDGLYENKIGAVVREIMSNGYDSHAAAGIGDAPISVTAPTNMDPTFRVRDYGTSMTHDQIMDMYSTIFESTKEHTNDQVGMFGLGSKSPFAYTDTFSVTAFLDGEKRVYVAHVSDDDVPQITHIVTEPQRQEPQGIEVAVPVQPPDVTRFHQEILRMVQAADTTPEVDGMGSVIEKPLLVGDSWRIIRDNNRTGQVAIRQGCVVYPVHTMGIKSIAYGYTVIVDVPIGSVEVTASRESLSLTPTTSDFVRARVAETDREIREWADNLQFKNRLDAYLRNNEYQFLSFGVGKAQISLTPDKPADRDRVPAQSVQVMKSQRKLQSTTQIRTNLDTVKVLVERPGEKVVRKKSRIAVFYEQNRYNRTIIVATTHELPRLVRLLGLDSSQIVPVSTLPDVPVLRGPSGPTGNRGKNAAPKKLAKGKFWLEKTGAKSLNISIAGQMIRNTDHLFNVEGGYTRWGGKPTNGVGSLLRGLDFDTDDIEFFTARQATDMGLTESRSLIPEIQKRAEKYAQDRELQKLLDAEANYSVYETYDRYGRVGNTVESILGVSAYGTKSTIYWVGVRSAEAVVESMIPPDYEELTDQDRLVAKFLGLEHNPKNLTLTVVDLDAKVKESVTPLKDLAAMDDPVSHLITLYMEIKEESNKS